MIPTPPLPADDGPWLASQFSQQTADQLPLPIIDPQINVGHP